MQAAARREFTHITWSLFFGKLVKQAQALPYTHAKSHPVDFAQLADRCREAGCNPAFDPEIRSANTARQILDLLEHDPARPALIECLVHRAKKAAEAFSGGQVSVEYMVFDFDGKQLF